jgi:hypothetical protein
MQAGWPHWQGSQSLAERQVSLQYSWPRGSWHWHWGWAHFWLVAVSFMALFLHGGDIIRPQAACRAVVWPGDCYVYTGQQLRSKKCNHAKACAVWKNTRIVKLTRG